ncbi:MAG: TlpA family protein disulfide reductase [Blastochloris sp.]|nr:TlpA family protein disulfide reductase [Blastochloris sp.]
MSGSLHLHSVFRSSLILVPMLCLALLACQKDPLPPVRNIETRPAPEFQMQDFAGTELSSASLKGKIVVLNFWATWAPGCSKEIPELIALQKKYQDRVRFVGIALGEQTAADASVLARQFGMNYPSAVAPSEFHRNFGGIDAIPSTFVIDPQWNLVNRYTGRISVQDLSAELDYMLFQAKQAQKNP